MVARDGRRLRDSVAPAATLPGTFHVAWPQDLCLPAAGRRARVIGIVENQLVTTAQVEGVRVEGGLPSPIPTGTCCD